MRIPDLAAAVVAGAASLLMVADARAHDFSITRATVIVKADESFLVDMHVHLDALALGVSATTSPIETAGLLQQLPPSEMQAVLADLESLLQKRVRLRLDGEKTIPVVSFPEYEHPLPPPSDGLPTVLGPTARLTGRIPPGTRELTFGASRSFNAIELKIFEERSGRLAEHLLIPGSDSPPFALEDESAREAEAGVAATQPARGGPQGLVPGVTFGQYQLLGFTHILPKGLDHILFVLGLYLLSTKLRPLLWQITMFTLAHTLTLGLAASGYVQLPAGIVEPLIAASIVYVAIENLLTTRMQPWRPALVFAFGLLHGLGFAGVLSELGLPADRFGEALVGFNIGVEMGQLTVVALAFAAIGWFRNRSWYRSAFVIPGSIAIALTGAYWFVERVS